MRVDIIVLEDRVGRFRLDMADGCTIIGAVVWTVYVEPQVAVWSDDEAARLRWILQWELRDLMVPECFDPSN
jgi:hypothetical protein